MPWKRRGNYSYFYRSERVAGGTVTRYVGRGQIAKLESGLVERQRVARQKEIAERRCIRATDARDIAMIGELDEVVRLAAKATLIAAGFHQHHRGEWRRRE